MGAARRGARLASASCEETGEQWRDLRVLEGCWRGAGGVSRLY